MRQVVDYSSARPNPADLAAAGYLGAMRYLAPLPNPKVITGDEVASLHTNGLAVGLVYEAGAANAFAGAAQGTKDGKLARAQADALGFPMDRPIYFAVDKDAQTFQFDAIDEYGRAFGVETGRPVGVYGQWAVVEAMLDRGVATFAWQTVAWSHGVRSTRACLFQRADADANPPPGCDVNEVLQDDWGQWPAPASTIPSVPQEDEDDMALSVVVMDDGSEWAITRELPPRRWHIPDEETRDDGVLLGLWKVATPGPSERDHLQRLCARMEIIPGVLPPSG